MPHDAQIFSGIENDWWCELFTFDSVAAGEFSEARTGSNARMMRLGSLHGFGPGC